LKFNKNSVKNKNHNNLVFFLVITTCEYLVVSRSIMLLEMQQIKYNFEHVYTSIKNNYFINLPDCGLFYLARYFLQV